ncbi:AVO1 [Candida pseudojiufengensis]|uniref:AVO1 n=1 Tax=Candida pseudojiufengensis TaxID=497109 RepID=UPI002224DB0D|nr:AVO1 [Candida pseudojiufengensis]KAI5961401.1 AVO1 [Candida pseudojiufengensis]
MAFPLEQSQLLNHLRTSYSILGEDSEYFKRILNNDPINLTTNNYSKSNNKNVILQNSPPITFELSHHIKDSIHEQYNTRHRHHHRHKKLTNSQNNIIPSNEITNKKSNTHLRKNSSSNTKHTESQTPHEINENDDKDKDTKGHVNGSSKSTTNYSSIFENNSIANFDTASISSNDVKQETDQSLTLETGPNKKKMNFAIRYPLGTKTQNKAKSKTKSKIPIVRLFQSGKTNTSSDSDMSDEDDLINSRKRFNVDTIEESREETTDEYSTENDPSNDTDNHNNSNDGISIDSDFGVPVDKTGKVVKNKPIKISDKPKVLVDEENSQNLESDEETDTEEDEAEDDSSNDSEFTDLDNDTILDSSLQSNSFTSELGKVIDNNVNVLSDFDSKDMRKKKRGNTISDHTVPKHFEPNFLDFEESLNFTSISRQSFVNLTPLEKSSITFDKIKPKSRATTKSNLSTIIDSKFKSTNVNPLNYYLFVDGTSCDSPSNVAQLDIFLPPKRTPTLKNISVNNTVTIVDCIGFILLKLSKFTELNKIKDSSYLNPNFWRLELVDEDGENYGSFGILDRNRILASYNNPKELALCRVKEVKEIDSYDKKSPLPIEFRQNLSAFERKKNSIDHVQALEGIPQIELMIGVYEYDNSGIPEKVAFKVPATYTMGQVLKEFCLQKGLITTKYRFKMVDETTDKSKFVKDVEICENLQSKVLELVPSEAKFNLVIESEEDKAMIGPTNTTAYSNITPADSTLPYITPNNGHLSNKMQKLSIAENPVPSITPEQQLRRESVNSTKSIKEALTSNKYLEDIIMGNNPQLPTNINSIYFKWNVLKSNSKMKKMKIKTFTEKMFIIDGDYIHITPLDDVLSKTIGNDSSIAAATTQPHQSHFNQHHHNLNHHINKTANTKTYSFHITQILKSKQYSKTPNHFRIIVQKQQSDQIHNDDNKNSNSKDSQLKKFYLVAESEIECSEIINKLQWVLQVYKVSSGAI